MATFSKVTMEMLLSTDEATMATVALKLATWWREEAVVRTPGVWVMPAVRTERGAGEVKETEAVTMAGAMATAVVAAISDAAAKVTGSWDVAVVEAAI